jgi:hypothetical protein
VRSDLVVLISVSKQVASLLAGVPLLRPSIASLQVVTEAEASASCAT